MEELSPFVTAIIILIVLAGLLIFYTFLGAALIRYCVRIIKIVWNSVD